MELHSLVSSLEYLVSNGRRVLLGGIRLGGSATHMYQTYVASIFAKVDMNATFTCVGFVNLRSQVDNTQTPGPAQASKQQTRRAIQSPTERSGRGGTTPVFRLRPTSPTGALASVFSPPPDDLSDRKAWPKHYFRLRPHVSDRGTQKPCSPLFSDWRNQSRLGSTDRRRPLGRDQETCGESRARRTSQTTIPGTIPRTPAETVLCDLPGMTEPKQYCRRRHFPLQYCGRH